MTRFAGLLVLLVGLGAVLAAALWLRAEPEAAAGNGGRAPYVLPVTVAEVVRREVRPSIHLTGSVRSARWARLAFEVGGTLASHDAQEGEAVAEDQILARLDAADQELGVALAEADLAVAERQVEELEAGTRAEVVQRLRAELEAAEADEELARLEVDRRRALADRDDVSRAEMDRVQAAWQAATARRQAAAQRLQEAEAGARPEELAVARARREVAATALATARRELEKTVLRAPWPGTIVRRLLSEGDVLSPGEVLFELADLDHLELDVEVPSTHALALGSSPPVVVHLDEAPDWSLETTIDTRVPAADRASRNFRAVARLDRAEAGELLEPGMFVRLEVQLDPLPDRLVVPSDAVRITEEGRIVVRVDEPGAAASGRDAPVGTWVPVRVLGADRGGTAVAPLTPGELAEGDRVVVVGVDLAWPGVPLLLPDGAGGDSP